MFTNNDEAAAVCQVYGRALGDPAPYKCTTTLAPEVCAPERRTVNTVNKQMAVYSQRQSGLKSMGQLMAASAVPNTSAAPFQAREHQCGLTAMTSNLSGDSTSQSSLVPPTMALRPVPGKSCPFPTVHVHSWDGLHGYGPHAPMFPHRPSSSATQGWLGEWSTTSGEAQGQRLTVIVKPMPDLDPSFLFSASYFASFFFLWFHWGLLGI